MSYVFAETIPSILPEVGTVENYVFGESEGHVVTINGQRSAFVEVLGTGIQGPIGPQGEQGIQGIQGPQGEQGPPGPGGTDAFYEHIQAVASATWSINHNLNKKPSITVVTSAGDVVIGDEHYVDNNTVTINFIAAFAGKAYLN